MKVKTEDLPESGTSQKAAIMVPKAQKKGVTFASKELHSNMEVKSKNIKKTKKNVNKKAKGSNIKSGLSKKNGFAMSEVTKGKGKKKHHTEYDEIEDATESVDSLDSGFVADNNSDTSLSSVNWLKVCIYTFAHCFVKKGCSFYRILNFNIKFTDFCIWLHCAVTN